MYFMFLGTSLYVFFKIFPNPDTTAMLTGGRKAEEVLPYFISHFMPQGISGLVIAGVLAAAMSSLSSSINSISAVSIVDIYRRHIRTGQPDTHYVTVAKGVSIAASVVMIAGAFILAAVNSKTLQDTATELAALTSGGLLGLYLLGFATKRADARAIGVGIAFTFSFSCWMAAGKLGWLPEWLPQGLRLPIDNYYTGVVGNIGMFVVGFVLSSLLPKRPRDLTNLTVYTQDATPLE
jgi:SSS family solute:Na+ symporter